MIDCSVIVLSYNTHDITDNCLARLKKSVQYAKKHGYRAEVIVIDNASTDGSIVMIKKKHNWVTIIASKINTGFSAGNNIGMEKSSGKYILLLNSDAFVEEETLVNSLQYFQSNENCDVIGCQLRFEGGGLQPSAGYLPDPLNTFLWIFGLANLPLFNVYRPIHPRNANFFNRAKEVEWVTGAFFMLRRELYEKTRGFDENLFMYGEEVEWCKRIHENGFHIWYVPEITITHIHKASSKDSQERPFVSEIKGFVYYFRKHDPTMYPIVKTVIAVGIIFRVFVFTLLMKPTRANAYMKSLSLF